VLHGKIAFCIVFIKFSLSQIDNFIIALTKLLWCRGYNSYPIILHGWCLLCLLSSTNVNKSFINKKNSFANRRQITKRLFLISFQYFCPKFKIRDFGSLFSWVLAFIREKRVENFCKYFSVKILYTKENKEILFIFPLIHCWCNKKKNLLCEEVQKEKFYTTRRRLFKEKPKVLSKCLNHVIRKGNFDFLFKEKSEVYL
jgi:hypothetical protein